MQRHPAAITDIDIPFVGRWHYSRAELIADGIVHAVGIVLAIAAGSALLALCGLPRRARRICRRGLLRRLAAHGAVGLAAYNLWPVTSPAKWILRRFDHAAIYLLIAATYTPFLAQLDGTPLAGWMIVAGLDRGSAWHRHQGASCPAASTGWPIVFYLAIGWSGIVLAEAARRDAADDVARAASSPAASSIPAASSSSPGSALRFHNAVWHGFVVTGAGLHLAAMVDCLVVNRL